jgi:hypothetical protein
MPRHTLYAYADGADLAEVAAALEQRLSSFVEGRKWACGKAWFVNQRSGDETCSRPGDIPLWDMGLNLELPDPGSEPRGWFADVEAIARFLGRLRGDYGRDFVIGIADAQSGVRVDLFGISDTSPDLAKLRSVIGVGEAG